MKRVASLIISVLMLSIWFCATNAGGREGEEHTAQLEQLLTLREKVTALKREQDFLLFQKEMYASDSKYLILNIVKRSGQLKYKNRVLKDFRLNSPNNYNANIIGPGMLTLTKKIDGKNNRFVLVFGRTLMLQWTRTAAFREEGPIPTFVLRKKDIRSVFFAVEEGARAYVVQ